MAEEIEMRWLARVDGLGQRLMKLLDVLRQYSPEGAGPWRVFLPRERAVIVDFTAESLDRIVFDEHCLHINGEKITESNSAFYPTVTVNVVSEIERDSPLFSMMGLIPVGVNYFQLDSSRFEGLFRDVVTLFDVPFAYQLSRIDEYGWDIDYALMLNAALTRDLYEYLGLHELRLAKILAPHLPRMGINFYSSSKKITGPVMPLRLGWLNCWSPEVAEQLGFPDPERDAHLLPLCTQLPSGHWIVKLTPEPLDFRIPGHAEAVVNAYARFDKIGRRKVLGAKKPSTSAGTTKDRSKKNAPIPTQTYLIHTKDDEGNWWRADLYPPVQASSEEEALRIYFCTNVHGRNPLPSETLIDLRDQYDGLCADLEGALPLSCNVDAWLET